MSSPSSPPTSSSAPRDPSGPSSVSEGLVLSLMCAAHALTHVYMLIFPAIIAPMRTSFGLERADFLAYANLSVVLFGLGAVPAGWLGDRIGEKTMLVLFFWLSAAGGTVIGLAQGTTTLAMGMLLLGLGTSIYHPVGLALLSRTVTDRGRAMGMNGFWGSAGTAIAPILAVQLAAIDPEGESWRWAYLGMTPVSFLIGLRLAFVSVPARAPEPAMRAQEAPVARGSIWVTVGLLLVAMTCGGAYFHLITTMLPTHLEMRIGASPESAARIAGWSTGAVLLIGGFGQIISGRLVGRGRPHVLYVRLLLLAVPIIALVSRLEGAPLVLGSALMAVTVFALQPVENVLLAAASPPGRRGLLFGLKFVLAFGVGGNGTWLSGQIADGLGVPAVFIVSAGFALVGCFFAIAARSTRAAREPAAV